MKKAYFAFLLATTFGGLSSAGAIATTAFGQASPPPQAAPAGDPGDSEPESKAENQDGPNP